jgi:hypothetical protein
VEVSFQAVKLYETELAVQLFIQADNIKFIKLHSAILKLKQITRASPAYLQFIHIAQRPHKKKQEVLGRTNHPLSFNKYNMGCIENKAFNISSLL